MESTLHVRHSDTTTNYSRLPLHRTLLSIWRRLRKIPLRTLNRATPATTLLSMLVALTKNGTKRISALRSPSALHVKEKETCILFRKIAVRTCRARHATDNTASTPIQEIAERLHYPLQHNKQRRHHHYHNSHQQRQQ